MPKKTKERRNSRKKVLNNKMLMNEFICIYNSQFSISIK